MHEIFRVILNYLFKIVQNILDFQEILKAKVAGGNDPSISQVVWRSKFYTQSKCISFFLPIRFESTRFLCYKSKPFPPPWNPSNITVVTYQRYVPTQIYFYIWKNTFLIQTGYILIDLNLIFPMKPSEFKISI